ncbi:hypothetical protein KM043_011129 [Ampulex compressa]|nr:hypothetical protein KM043_011129 [Ampulex compressa]
MSPRVPEVARVWAALWTSKSGRMCLHFCSSHRGSNESKSDSWQARKRGVENEASQCLDIVARVPPRIPDDQRGLAESSKPEYDYVSSDKQRRARAARRILNESIIAYSPLDRASFPFDSSSLAYIFLFLFTTRQRDTAAFSSIRRMDASLHHCSPRKRNS